MKFTSSNCHVKLASVLSNAKPDLHIPLLIANMPSRGRFFLQSSAFPGASGDKKDIINMLLLLLHSKEDTRGSIPLPPRQYLGGAKSLHGATARAKSRGHAKTYRPLEEN